MRWLRSGFTLAFFALFGVGALILSYFVLPFVRKKEHALVVVRSVWRIILQGFIITGLIRIDRSALTQPIRGAVILANHPSLIDVVILTALLPRTFSVAKSAFSIIEAISGPGDGACTEIISPLLPMTM